MKNQAFPRSKSQAGSVFILIFIMIALFAALSFALSKSFTGGSATVKKETQKLAAGDYLDYARKMRTAVQGLLIDGCDGTQISFDDPSWTGYENPKSPTDKSCHVFSAAGGKMEFPPYPYLNFSAVSFIYPAEDGYVSPREQVLMYFVVTPEICEAVNKELGLPFPPALDWYDPDVKFTGEYDTNTNGTPDDSGPVEAFYGKQTGCMKISWNIIPDEPYYFYQVLFP